MTGWQAGLLGSTFIVGTVIQGLITLNSPTYVPERWHGTPIVWAIVMCLRRLQHLSGEEVTSR